MPDTLPAAGVLVAVEIERKFRLRAAPPAEVLAREGAVTRRLEQVYLAGSPAGRRIRQITHADGRVEHRLTRKERLRAFAFREDERSIDAGTYRELLAEADPERRPVRKVRHVVPHGSQALEIDVFESTPGLVLLEVELRDDDESIVLPSWLGEWREVTGDPAYTNANLARTGAVVPRW
jgi:CYTH domain-containing protein